VLTFSDIDSVQNRITYVHNQQYADSKICFIEEGKCRDWFLIFLTLRNNTRQEQYLKSSGSPLKKLTNELAFAVNAATDEDVNDGFHT
jgi:hypothetical protein